MIEEEIINAAIEIAKTDFIKYPNFDKNIGLSFKEALMIVISDTITNIESQKIYDFISNELKYLL